MIGKLAFAFALLAAGHSLADNRSKVWTGLSLAYKFNETFSFQLVEENRFDDKHYTTELTSGYLRAKLADWVSVALTDRAVYSRSAGTSNWRRENRLGADLTLGTDYAGWKFDNRAWFIWRDREGRSDQFRFRDRVRVRAPWKWTQFKINPYLSEEAFFDDKDGTASDKWDELRTQAGLTYKLAKHVGASTYYMLQQQRSDGDWSPNHIIGVTLGLSF